MDGTDVEHIEVVLTDRESATEQLSAYRLEDFERTQLHKLRIEAQAVLIFTQPRLFFASLLESVAQQIGELLGKSHKRQPQIEEILWYKHEHWYEILWLGLQPWFSWLWNYTRVIYYGFISSPSNALRSLRLTWLSWLFLFVLAPFLLLFTLSIEILLFSFPSLLGPLDSLGSRFVVNSSLFDDMDEVSSQAKVELSNSDKSTPYSQVLAEFLLNVSAAVYARKADAFAEAERQYREYAAHDGLPLPLKPFLARDTARRDSIQSLLDESQRTLIDFAHKLSLNTVVVSDLDSGYGGPTASMFWNLDSNDSNQFLIIAITGTSLFEPAEYLIDASFQKVQVDPEFVPFPVHTPCYAHEGFYYSLVPDRNGQYQDWLKHDLDDLYPIKAIVKAIRTKARAMKIKNPKLRKIPIWFTGHSLGAAIAALLFATLSTETEDLMDVIEIRNGYAFGTPMSTDHNFVAAYYRDLPGKDPDRSPKGSGQQTVPRNFWRVINDHDFVARLPPNLNTIHSNGGTGILDTTDHAHALLDGSILDYSTIGYGIKYSPDGLLPIGIDVERFAVSCNLSVVPVPRSGVGTWLANSAFSPLKIFLQHSPIVYKSNLRRARAEIKRLQTQQAAQNHLSD